jgi:hypothetical protein
MKTEVTMEQPVVTFTDHLQECAECSGTLRLCPVGDSLLSAETNYEKFVSEDPALETFRKIFLKK